MQGISKADAEKEKTKTEKDKNQDDSLFDLDGTNEHREKLASDAKTRNEFYYSFLRRVRKNFKLIFNFTPSGYDFREKMEHHKGLMMNS